MAQADDAAPEENILNSPSAAALNDYLTLMEETEAPRQYHIWGLISAAAGIIGGTAAFTRGPLFTISPNLFIVLLGPSGVRKSSAINPIIDLLRETSVNLGPTDTGGQRQGIMSAMVGLHRNRPYDRKFFKDGDEIRPLFEHLIHRRKSADIFFAASELGRLLGSSSREMSDFFVDLYDKSPIAYQTRSSETLIHGGIANLLGGTTPSSLASILPDGATGHGILSRMIFVWADQKYKDVPIPPVPQEEWYEKRDSIVERLEWIDHNRGSFAFETDAAEEYESLYTYRAELKDPRLEHYRARRAIHLLKVAICLAALRNSLIIERTDVALGHELLVAAEADMHRALEFFGKNKAFVGRMLIIQFLRARDSKMGNRSELVAAAASELNRREAEEALESMIASKELTPFGEVYLLTEAAESVRGMSRRQR